MVTSFSGADKPDRSTPPAGVRVARERVVIVALLGVALASLLVRCVSIAEPLGIDQSLWASAVRGMSRGQLLYQDVWEQRPPGIYWIYLAAFHLLGWAASTVAWLDIAAAAATTWLLYASARRLDGALAGALAASLYAALTMPAWLYGHGGFLERSVCETFIVVCTGVGALAAILLRDRQSLAAAAVLGLSAGAAVVFKPNAGLYFPALLLWVALYRRKEGTEDRARWLALGRPFAIAAAAAAVVPAAALLWLWRIGTIGEAAIAVVDFNRFYVGEGFEPASYALLFSKAVFLRMKTEPLWLAGTASTLVAGLHLIRKRTLPPLAGLAVIWGAASALAIIVNGARLFNSYFIQAMPPLALLSAWMFAGAARPGAIRKAAAAVTAALMLFVMADRGYVSRVYDVARADFDRLLGRTDETSYLDRFGGYANSRGYSARANRELAEYVKAHTTPDERIFLFGINGAGVYFAADRLTAHRFLRVNFFVETSFPDPRFRLEAVVADLAERQPRYLIFERLHSLSAMGVAADSLIEHPALSALLSGYTLETRIEDFTLFRRNTDTASGTR